jgi:hypothetical protein
VFHFGVGWYMRTPKSGLHLSTRGEARRPLRRMRDSCRLSLMRGDGIRKSTMRKSVARRGVIGIKFVGQGN